MTYWNGYDTKPMGGGNPYYCCVGCGRTDPEINGDIEKHVSGCSEVAKYHREQSRPTPETYSVMVEEYREMGVAELVMTVDGLHASIAGYHIDDLNDAEKRAEKITAQLGIHNAGTVRA